MSIKFLSAILGPEMGAPILWTPGKKKRPFCRKAMSIKFFVLGGGGVFWVFLGGAGCRFYFYGREDFSDFLQTPKETFFLRFSRVSGRAAFPGPFQRAVFPKNSPRASIGRFPSIKSRFPPP